MYSRSAFGNYYPINSVIHRLNPVIKLLNFVIILILTIISNSLYINIFISCLLLVMIMMSFVPLRYYLRTLFSLIPLYIVIYVLGICFSLSNKEILIYIIRVINIFEYLLILAYTTSPSESVYGIEKFLSLFNFLFLPLSKLSFKINSLLRYYPTSINAEHKVMLASSVRGVDYYNTNFLGRLYTYKKIRKGKKKIRKLNNNEINFSQELRMYNVNKYRTNYRTNKVSFLDIFFLLFHLLLVYAFLVEGGYL